MHNLSDIKLKIAFTVRKRQREWRGLADWGNSGEPRECYHMQETLDTTTFVSRALRLVSTYFGVSFGLDDDVWSIVATYNI